MEFIQRVHVTVNGRVVTEPSAIVDAVTDKGYFDGTPVQTKVHEYLLLNKPQGYVTTVKDPHAKKTVLDLLPAQYRHLYPVGRLDKDTEGLLLLTNDGDTAYKLMHPKFNIDKTYFVEIQGRLKDSDGKRLEEGVLLDSRITASSKITRLKLSGDKTEFHITIHEGRKRHIRRMLSLIRYRVIRLRRIVHGPLILDQLPPGGWRVLTGDEISALKKL